METEAGEEVVGGEVLKWVEAGADCADVGIWTIERRDRLPQSEVAPRPRPRTCEMAREVPVGGPFTDAALRHELRLHLVVRQQRERVEVELAPREREDVLGLAAREADGYELGVSGERNALARRERVRLCREGAELDDEPVAHCERREERHLLRRAGRDEGLEWIDGERRPQPTESLDEAREDRLRRSECVESVEIELRAEQLARDRLDVERK